MSNSPDPAIHPVEAFFPERRAGSLSPLRSIVCASDLSEGADEAIRQAGILSQAYGASLEVLYVTSSPDGGHPALAHLRRHPRARAALEAARERARKELTSRVASLTGASSNEAKVLVAEGVPYAAIVQRADEVGADLIVVGSEGATGLGMQHLGEVAVRVVRHAHRSVLVARPGPGSGKILAATDFSDPSLPALTSAAEEARRRGASLTVVHNVDPELDAFGPEVVATLLQLFSHDFMAEVGRGARDRLLEVLRRLGVDGEAVITHGAASASILRLAEDLPADLVVVGNSGGTGLAGVLVGSVAERVVRWAPCSVLVVRRRR